MSEANLQKKYLKNNILKMHKDRQIVFNVYH